MTLTLNAKINRIEPPFWFAGMQNPEVQILFYGENIATYTITVSNAVAITTIKRTENPNYIFVTINTKRIPACTLIFTFKSNEKPSFTQNYSLKQRRPNSAQRKSYDSSDVIYLIMPDRFANGNGENNNDSTTCEKYNRELPGGRHGGDIQGIINNLDYISSIGATTIWITPLCEDNDNEHSYHGYAQSDVYKIDPRYGTNEDYARLALEMHKKNMKLVLDYVTNHWGLKHWMMADLPTKNWINQFDTYIQTNHIRTTISDIHSSKIDEETCIKGWFVPTMPDLNLTNPLVLKYLVQNAIWWIEYADLDGFRVDTYNYSDPKGISKWTKAITDEYPNFNLVGEVWMQNQSQISYWQKDSPIGKIQNFNSYLPSVMDFTLQVALSKVFNEDVADSYNGMIKVYDNFSNDYLYANIHNLLLFIENHDTSRFNDIYNDDIRKHKMALAIIATVRGIPQLYYGSEIGMKGNKDYGDADIRQDFPGGWQNDSNNAFTREGRTERQNEYFDFTSRLFQWRKTSKAIHSGKMTHYIPEDNVYIYFRYLDNEHVMVILNNSNYPKTVSTDRFKENIQNHTTGKDILSENTYDLFNEITLEPKSVVVLELK